MSYRPTVAVALLLVLFAPSVATAHPGATDARRCHTGTDGNEHCHAEDEDGATDGASVSITTPAQAASVSFPLELRGRAAGGTMVEIKLNDVIQGRSIIGGDGTWKFIISKAPAATVIELHASVLDSAGGAQASDVRSVNRAQAPPKPMRTPTPARARKTNEDSGAFAVTPLPDSITKADQGPQRVVVGSEVPWLQVGFGTIGGLLGAYIGLVFTDSLVDENGIFEQLTGRGFWLLLNASLGSAMGAGSSVYLYGQLAGGRGSMLVSQIGGMIGPTLAAVTIASLLDPDPRPEWDRSRDPLPDADVCAAVCIGSIGELSAAEQLGLGAGVSLLAAVGATAAYWAWQPDHVELAYEITPMFDPTTGTAGATVSFPFWGPR